MDHGVSMAGKRNAGQASALSAPAPSARPDVAVSPPDAALGALLRGYAEASRGGREQVAIDVERVGGFEHVARTRGGHELKLDEPVAFGGQGAAPDPAEALLAAVGASFSVTLTAHAAMADVPIDHVRIAVTAMLDANAFFEPGTGTPGLLDAEIDVELHSRAARDAIEALVARAMAASPVMGALAFMPRITLRLESGR